MLDPKLSRLVAAIIRAQMNKEQLIRRTAVIVLISLGMIYALVTFPASRQDTHRLLDFSEFYAAAEMVRHGQGKHLYDLRLQAEYQLQVAPVHAFYLRPPFESVLFLPLTYLSYRAAYAVWTMFTLVVLILAALLIRKYTNALGALAQYAHGIPVDFGLLLLLFLTFGPTMNCFMIGQDSILLLLVYTVALLALRRGKEFHAGGVLACGLFKFHLVLPFAIIFAIRRRIAFLVGFFIVALALIAISVLVGGVGVLASYPEMFLNPDYRRLMAFQPEYAANVRGLLYLMGGRILPWTSATMVALLSLLLWYAAARAWKADQLNLCFSAAVIVSLLTGFHAFVYDLAILLLPICIICGELAARKTLLSAPVFNYTLLLLFIPPVHHILITHHMYALMCLPLLLLFGYTLKLIGSL